MSTRTHGRIESVEVEGGAGVEGGEPGGRARREAGAARRAGSLPGEARERLAGELLSPASGRSRGPRDELVEEALARARLRERGLPVEALPPEARERLSDELIDELLRGARTEEELVGPGGLLAELTRRLVERALEVELTEHLGFERHAEPPGGAGNTRNGTTPKTLQTEHGPVRVEAPRDRRGTFEPQLVKKRQRRFEGFDDKIVALYARGMTTRESEGHLREIYGASVSRDTISRVTAAVLEDAQAWQSRPLESIYPIVYLDALVVKIRDGNAVHKHSAYLAIGVNTDGERDTLGIWFQRSEGAKFWLSVLTELKQRGVEDVLICCVDGLKGFGEAIEAVYPKAWVQTCVVHQIRHSLRFVPYRDRRAVAKDLKRIYTASDRDQAERELERFAEQWDGRYPMISRSWTENWERIVPFLSFPPDVRRIVYTTNTIEALNRQIRKIIKSRGSFPTEDAARKLLYLTITNAQQNWRTAYNWSSALAAFRIHFGDRLP